jgi:hypothetical protein
MSKSETSSTARACACIHEAEPRVSKSETSSIARARACMHVTFKITGGEHAAMLCA